MKSFLDYLNEEKLKGNQHKLDVNKNGKLDKFDFMALKNKNKIKEYVDDQGKLVEKPEVKKVADYEGPDAKTPPDKKAAPYKPANDNVKSPTVDVEKNGLGEMGDKNLKYEPNTDYKQDVIKSSWNKTESFLNKTKSTIDFDKQKSEVLYWSDNVLTFKDRFIPIFIKEQIENSYWDETYNTFKLFKIIENKGVYCQ